jgi:hypothetical protein
VQQTVRAQESSIASYKLANLLQFYALTMRRTLGEDAVLSVTLDEYVYGDPTAAHAFTCMQAHRRGVSGVLRLDRGTGPCTTSHDASLSSCSLPLCSRLTPSAGRERPRP